MPRFDTRLALMRAAEQLFAQQGVDRVSLREIAIAAGQRNVSAATYHFGSKRELIEAILERHSLPMQSSWRPLLEQDAQQPVSLHALLEAVVRPLAAKIEDADGGRSYLELCAELVSSRSFPLMGMRIANTAEAQDITRRIAGRGPEVPPMVRVVRTTRLASLIYGSLGDYLRLLHNGVDIPRGVFISDLVNTLAGAVQACPPSGT
ncbi:MAG: TetR family transcriptional regulator [Myxococcales bacterium]|nr:MAG: TetR family transcriptional regulator [Myxococcales bacterium]